MATPDLSSSYVTYGMLQKNHEFVDWVRVDLGEDDKVHVQNANASSSEGDSFKDMDERAFEKFKTQWQEISASETLSRNSSTESFAMVQDSINVGKKLLATASAKTLTPDSISYGVFDSDWNPVKLSPRHSNVDVAILLHAADKNKFNTELRTYLNETLEGDITTTHSDRTKSMVMDGVLPIVPVRRSVHQQFLIKQSVQLFFRKSSIEFFACFPLRYSPRTIYRFDMVNGGIDYAFWQKLQQQSNNAEKPTMNDKLLEMKSSIVSNTAELKENFQKSTVDLKNNINEKVVSTRESTKKMPMKLSAMRWKMATNAATMKNNFASKVTTTKDSLLKRNGKLEGESPTAAAAASEPPATNALAKMSQMKLRMSKNTANMRNKFSWKLSKDSLLKTNNATTSSNEADGASAAEQTTVTEKVNQMKQKMTENTNVMKQKMTENTNVMKQKMTENTNVMKQRMTESTNVVKQRVTENTNQMTQKMNESTVNMRNLLTGKTSPSKNKLSLWNIGKKKSHDEAEAKAAAATPEDTDTMDIDSLLSESFNFTIDGDDDVAASSSKPALPASEPSGYVALSFDDAPCRFNDRGHSQMENVLDLLDKYDAKATFMVISSFLENSHEADMIRLLKEGHELANHGVRDEAMDKMATSVDVFLEALDECNTKITDLQKKADVSDIGVKWFRAPQSRYTKTMEEGLVARDMHNVMCDAYAACPIVEDGPWIASALSKQIRNGSIALLHMPEKMGFREHCLEALELLLEDLCKKRNFKVVTVGELQKLADEVAASKAKESGKAPEESKEDGEIEFL